MKTFKKNFLIVLLLYNISCGSIKGVYYKLDYIKNIKRLNDIILLIYKTAENNKKIIISSEDANQPQKVVVKYDFSQTSKIIEKEANNIKNILLNLEVIVNYNGDLRDDVLFISTFTYLQLYFHSEKPSKYFENIYLNLNQFDNIINDAKIDAKTKKYFTCFFNKKIQDIYYHKNLTEKEILSNVLHSLACKYLGKDYSKEELSRLSICEKIEN